MKSKPNIIVLTYIGELYTVAMDLESSVANHMEMGFDLIGFSHSSSGDAYSVIAVFKKSKPQKRKLK